MILGANKLLCCSLCCCWAFSPANMDTQVDISSRMAHSAGLRSVAKKARFHSSQYWITHLQRNPKKRQHSGQAFSVNRHSASTGFGWRLS